MKCMGVDKIDKLKEIFEAEVLCFKITAGISTRTKKRTI
jgi:hypothetical protein